MTIFQDPVLVALAVFAVIWLLELIPAIKASPAWAKVIGAAAVAAGPAAASLAAGVDALTVLKSFAVTVAASAGVNGWWNKLRPGASGAADGP